MTRQDTEEMVQPGKTFECPRDEKHVLIYNAVNDLNLVLVMAEKLLRKITTEPADSPDKEPPEVKAVPGLLEVLNKTPERINSIHEGFLAALSDIEKVLF